MKNTYISFGFLVLAMFVLAIPSFGDESILATNEFLPIKADLESPVSMYLIKFDLSGIPENASIDAAILRLTADVDSTTDAPLCLGAYPVLEDWTSSSQPVVNTDVPYADTVVSVVFDPGTTGRQVDFSVANLVQAWVSMQRDNFGVAITGYDNPGSGLRIYTDNPGVVAQLHILYTCRRSSE